MSSQTGELQIDAVDGNTVRGWFRSVYEKDVHNPSREFAARVLFEAFQQIGVSSTSARSCPRSSRARSPRRTRLPRISRSRWRATRSSRTSASAWSATGRPTTSAEPAARGSIRSEEHAWAVPGVIVGEHEAEGGHRDRRGEGVDLVPSPRGDEEGLSQAPTRPTAGATRARDRSCLRRAAAGGRAAVGGLRGALGGGALGGDPHRALGRLHAVSTRSPRHKVDARVSWGQPGVRRGANL